MKVNFKPVGDYVGSGEIYKVRSQSNPFLWHFVVILDSVPADGDTLPEIVTCSCTGFQTHGTCWHTDEIWEWDEARNQPESSAEVPTMPEESTLEQDTD